MSNLGIGVLIGLLGGNEESVNAFKGAIGKKISALSLGEDDALHFVFEDGSKLKLFDDGQSCCESRYMRTDDDLNAFVGAELLSAVVREAPNEADEYGGHEVAFLVVTTSKGAFTMASHNEHNGYYGGFCIRAAIE
jgi:hypothetical protein